MEQRSTRSENGLQNASTSTAATSSALATASTAATSATASVATTAANNSTKRTSSVAELDSVVAKSTRSGESNIDEALDDEDLLKEEIAALEAMEASQQRIIPIQNAKIAKLTAIVQPKRFSAHEPK